MFNGLSARLEGRLVTLEPLGPEHEEGLRAAADDERIWQWMLTRDVDAWIDDALGHGDDRQPSSSNACRKSRYFASVLAPVPQAAGLSQVLPISSRRCSGASDM